MLLVDFSSLAISAVLYYHQKTGEQFDMQLTRQVILSSLIEQKKKLKEYADEIVLCMDSRKGYWRKKVFAEYKGKRAAARKQSSFDWGSFFPHFDQFKQELADFFPVRCVQVDGAEADDVIATLAERFGAQMPVCIASADEDFIQIQQNVCPKIKQWSNAKKKFLTPANLKYDLFEHIVRGDVGDGIPNILSDNDTLMNPDKKQPSITKRMLAGWEQYGLAQPEKFCTSIEMLEHFRRNELLIDLRKVPEELRGRIVETYAANPPQRGKVYGYLVANRLKKIISNGGF